MACITYTDGTDYTTSEAVFKEPVHPNHRKKKKNINPCLESNGPKCLWFFCMPELCQCECTALIYYCVHYDDVVYSAAVEVPVD